MVRRAAISVDGHKPLTMAGWALSAVQLATGSQRCVSICRGNVSSFFVLVPWSVYTLHFRFPQKRLCIGVGVWASRYIFNETDARNVWPP